jgi:hypothetical protein
MDKITLKVRLRRRFYVLLAIITVVSKINIKQGTSMLNRLSTKMDKYIKVAK